MAAMDDPVPGESIRIGVDIGGTFTDLVLDCGGRIHVTKVPSVTGDPGKGVLTALHRAADALALGLDTLLARTTLFVHGSTIATNTVLEHKGATVGLITTGGFRDSLEIRRGLRSDPWEHRTPYPPVLVPRYLRLPVPGRLDANAVEIAPVEIGALDGIVRAFDDASVESISVCLLNSYLDPAHEITYGEKLRALRPGGWLSLSHEIVPVMGEYERTATTVLNAYIAPRTVGYLGTLDRSLRTAGLARSMLLVQNNGGSIGADQIGNRPVTLLLSGPAAGVGALDLARDALGTDRLIGMEIGGTSCDVMLMEDGAVPTSDALSVGDYDAAVPSIDIHTIGAGGGTIAHVDAAGRLEVGPHGAGAYPGPAAYGLGGDAPTITDALLVLSRLRGGPYPGASVSLDAELARDAIARRIAEPLSLSVEDAAAGIVRLLEQNLLQAVEQMTLERGLDPRTFALVAAGGAGPMHGASIGRRLGCRQVHVPRHSGAYCALGMLNTDVRHDLIRAYYAPLDSADRLRCAAPTPRSRRTDARHSRRTGSSRTRRVSIVSWICATSASNGRSRYSRTTASRAGSGIVSRPYTNGATGTRSRTGSWRSLRCGSSRPASFPG